MPHSESHSEWRPFPPCMFLVVTASRGKWLPLNRRREKKAKKRREAKKAPFGRMCIPHQICIQLLKARMEEGSGEGGSKKEVGRNKREDAHFPAPLQREATVGRTDRRRRHCRRRRTPARALRLYKYTVHTYKQRTLLMEKRHRE